MEFKIKLATTLLIFVLLVLSFGVAFDPLHVAAFRNSEAATLVIGQPNFTTDISPVSGAPSNQANLLAPQRVSFDSSGNLWVLDGNNGRALEFKPPFTNGENASIVIGQTNFTQTCCQSSPNSSTLSSPNGMAFDSSGDLWISDSVFARILEFKPQFTNSENANLVIGQPNFTATVDYTYNTSQFSIEDPTTIAFDHNGDLWAADIAAQRVLEYTPPFSDGMNASLVLGEPNFTDSQPSSALPTQSSINTPQGIAFDQSDNLWVAAQAQHRILEFKSPFSNDENATLVLGEPDFVSANNLIIPEANNLYGPKDLTFDKSGNLWVSDTQANRVIEYPAPFKTDENATVAIGAFNLTTISYRNESQVGLITPTGLTFDSSGSIWIADTQNDRVLEFPNLAPSNSTSTVIASPTTSVGLQSSTTTRGTSTSSSASTLISTKSTTVNSPPTTLATTASSATSSATSLSFSSLVYIAVAVLVTTAVSGVTIIKKRKTLRAERG